MAKTWISDDHMKIPSDGDVSAPGGWTQLDPIGDVSKPIIAIWLGENNFH